MTTNPSAVLVTGASTGIGEACARFFDERGLRVFAGVRRETDAERLREGQSERMTPVLLDITDQSQIDAAIGTVEAATDGGGLAGLVNNAGVARGGPLEYLPIEEWRDQLEINVVGQVAMTKAALPLIRRGPGRIVFIGSIAGRVPPRSWAPTPRRSTPSRPSGSRCGTSCGRGASTWRSSSRGPSPPRSGARAARPSPA
jgi:NAD(P)-dependent dehydrogenase (short-subunit alcohol dehydrogenase family)